MNRRRKIFLGALALVLCLGLFQPMPARAADLYFTAINENIQPLTADTMPVWHNRIIYVPYSLFDQGTTGINLDIYCSYSRNTNTVTLLNLKKILVFNLNTGECRDDLTGETFSAPAIFRNNRPYLPLPTVCSFFGLTYSYSTINQGYLVRIKNGAASLSDDRLIEAGQSRINQRLSEYLQSLAATTTTPVTPAPVAPPVVPTIPEVNDNVSSSNVRTYLAFRCRQAEGVAGVLDALDAGGMFGLFFFTPQALEESEDLVRRILGTGHSIGLLAEGGTPETTRQLLEEGQDILRRIHYTRTAAALVPRDQKNSLENEGWVCWNETLSLSPTASSGSASFASSVLRRLEGRTYTIYLTLPASADTGRILPALLRQLDSRHFVVSVPMETRL